MNGSKIPASGLVHAQQQVRQYMHWTIDNKDFLRDRVCPNIIADNTEGVLIIGKKSDLDPTELSLLENLDAEASPSRYEIKTFDKILEENQTIYENIRKMPEISRK
jgi:hypothetical protein